MPYLLKSVYYSVGSQGSSEFCRFESEAILLCFWLAEICVLNICNETVVHYLYNRIGHQITIKKTSLQSDHNLLKNSLFCHIFTTNHNFDHFIAIF